jgi:hypothetical protein
MTLLDQVIPLTSIDDDERREEGRFGIKFKMFVFVQRHAVDALRDFQDRLYQKRQKI